MASSVIVGTQWGDEGKGKIIDIMAKKADLVIRSSGGNNAGHTVVHGDEGYKLHLLPSGILYPKTTCLIGSGVVVDPKVLLGEISEMNKRGVTCDNLRIDSRAGTASLTDLKRSSRQSKRVLMSAQPAAVSVRATPTRQDALVSECTICAVPSASKSSSRTPAS